MRIKIFLGEVDEIEKLINEWIAQQHYIIIQDIEIEIKEASNTNSFIGIVKYKHEVW